MRRRVHHRSVNDDAVELLQAIEGRSRNWAALMTHGAITRIARRAKCVIAWRFVVEAQGNGSGDQERQERPA